MEKHKCETCGKEFERYLSPRSKHAYCSKECYAKSIKPKNAILVKCEVCGKEFLRAPSVIKGHILCSKECFVEFQRKTIHVKCDYCGKELTRSPSLLHEHNFCNPQCIGKWNSKNRLREKAANYRTGTTTRNGYILELKNDERYSGTHISQHRLVMEKHLGRNLSKDEVVHHIDKNKSNNNIENLMLLTKSDHARIHSKERWDNFHGLKNPKKEGHQ